MTRRRLPLMLTGVLAAALAVISTAHADDPPLAVDAYWQQLEATRDVVVGLGEAEAETAQTQLAAEADHWQAIAAVRLADGTVMPLDHSFLVAQLRADPPDLEQLDGLLAALLNGRDALKPVTVPALANADLQSILRRSEFQWPEEETGTSWWDEFWRRFWAWVDSWWPQGDAGAGGPSLLNYLMTALGTAVLAAVLFFVLRALSINFVPDMALNADQDGDLIPLTAEAALQQAQTFSAGGDYRTAVRYLYLSALLSLEERGLLRYNRAQTNREYLRSVAHRPELAAVLRDVVDVFDRVWYGFQPLDQDEYSHYADRVAELNRTRAIQPKRGASS